MDHVSNSTQLIVAEINPSDLMQLALYSLNRCDGMGK